jgi:hypothetical protein
MPLDYPEYEFTANSDSWWLRLELKDYEGGLSSASVTSASLSDVPLAANQLNSFPEVIDFRYKRSDTDADWYLLGLAYYVPDSGVIDIPIAQLFVETEVGTRLHFLVVTNSESKTLAGGEIVWVRDKSRETSPSDVQVCESDEYLSLRLTAEGVTPAVADSTHLSDKPLALGDGNRFRLLVRSQGPLSWNPWTAVGAVGSTGPLVLNDETARIIDVQIGEIFSNAEPGFVVQYIVAEEPDVADLLDVLLPDVDPEDLLGFVSSMKATGTVIEGGEMTYSPGECQPAPEDDEPDTNRYDVQASEDATRMRFRLRNFSPDPATTKVVSVSVGRPPEPLSSGEGTYLFRYRMNGGSSGEWQYLPVFFDANVGIAEVDVSELLAGDFIDIEYRLVLESEQ